MLAGKFCNTQNHTYLVIHAVILRTTCILGRLSKQRVIQLCGAE
jgi:hypothetical protein